MIGFYRIVREHGGVLGIVCALLGIAYAQPWIRAKHAQLRETSEVYLLPPPRQLEVASLGHKSALADLLWANVLVSQGLRLGERRRFETVVPYLEAIVELDPKWRDPYCMAEALVTLQSKPATIDEIRATRALLERGVRERPFDADLWLRLGQFVGFIIPNNYLEHLPEERAAWRRDGAEHLKRASELAAGDPSIAWLSIGGARIFAETGQMDRAIEMYEHVLATTEDLELRDKIEGLLVAMRRKRALGEGEVQGLQAAARREAFRELKFREYPGLPATGGRAMPYPRDAALCAGGAASPTAMEAGCSGSWAEFAERSPYGGRSPQSK